MNAPARDITPAAPCNVEAEQALLGAIMMNNALLGYVAAEVGPEQFSEPVHQAIFAECQRQIAAGRTANPVTLRDAFPDLKIAGDVSISQYLSRLCSESIASPGTARDAATVLRDLSVMREMIAVADDLRGARQRSTPPDLAIADAWERLDSVRASVGGRVDDRGSIAALVERARRDREEGRQNSHVVTTGLPDLDTFIGGGWRSQRLFLFAGRPGMGKTVFGVATMRKVARQGVGVLFNSLELDGDEVRARLTAAELSRSTYPIEYSRIVAGTLNNDEWSDVDQAESALSALPIEVDATTALSMADIEARARLTRDRLAKRGTRLGLIVIDYLGLVRAADRYRGNKVNELGEIALAAKQMAKRLDAAVLLLAQLNRGVESRDDKTPTMADLRASGEVEEHADVVGLLYREAYYVRQTPEYRREEPDAIAHFMRVKNSLDVVLGKNRLGPTVTVNLWCDPALSAVECLAKGG